MTMTQSCLVLRLAGPLQSWGEASRHQRRDTAAEPTKSGIVGLLAAASGRRRTNPIEDLTELTLGVRTDQQGQLLRDYHTVSNYDGSGLPTSQVNAKGRQNRLKQGSTKVTERFYLTDAVFIAAICGPDDLLQQLAEAISRPVFALSLGRRGCPPTWPLHLRSGRKALWTGDPLAVLTDVPWQPGHARHRTAERDGQTSVQLRVVVDDLDGDQTAHDVPTTFDPQRRSRSHRRITQSWVTVPTGIEVAARQQLPEHDPLALLGG